METDNKLVVNQNFCCNCGSQESLKDTEHKWWHAPDNINLVGKFCAKCSLQHNLLLYIQKALFVLAVIFGLVTIITFIAEILDIADSYIYFFTILLAVGFMLAGLAIAEKADYKKYDHPYNEIEKILEGYEDYIKQENTFIDLLLKTYDTCEEIKNKCGEAFAVSNLLNIIIPNDASIDEVKLSYLVALKEVVAAGDIFKLEFTESLTPKQKTVFTDMVEKSIKPNKKISSMDLRSLLESVSLEAIDEQLLNVFHEADNMGTRHDNPNIAASYWMTRINSVKKDPFLLYTFENKNDAKEALMELPCIHIAEDTRKLICTETLVFGYYKTKNGKYEAVLCGEDLSHELWTQAKESFIKHNGQLKNDLEPDIRDSATIKSQIENPDEVTFEYEDRQEKFGQTMIYRIHKGPDAASAKAFLQNISVTEQYYYVVVETPEGNYCRDIQGIYKE